MEKENIKNLFLKNDIPIQEDIVLAPFTTWKIGGKADFFIIVLENSDLIKICNICNSNEIPLTILGQGSNVLISDNGIRGIVVINRISKISVISQKEGGQGIKKIITPRLENSSFSDVNYYEKKIMDVQVKVSSGTSLAYTINNLLNQGITGLQWFAGIPGTIGGAVYNNIHGGNHYLSEYIDNVTAITDKGELTRLNKDVLVFDYDYSSFQDNKQIIMEVVLILNRGNIKKAQKAAHQLILKKREHLPYNSAGCCFKNLTLEEKNKYNIANGSWGYIIENILKLKGRRIGDAKISERHAAFIENIGKATSQDVLDLINLVYFTAKEKIEITPSTEIFFLGFDSKDIAHLL